MAVTYDTAENSQRILVLRYAPLLIWIAVIFYLSSGQGSMTETSRFIRPILEFLFPNTPESSLLIYHGYIRKFAHLAVYLVLGTLALRAFFFSRAAVKLVAALLLVAVVASLDELNQSFNPKRTGAILDVLLDCIGGIAGIALAAFYYRRFYRSDIHSDP